MTHPEELLVGHVDGTLTPKERAVLDAHLSACETCRDELRLAARAVAALDELPEEPVPFGAMNPVTAEIRRRMSAPRPMPWRARLQWVAGLAAAAALVAAIAVNLPHPGGGGAVTEAGGGAAATPAPALGALAPGTSIPVESQPNADYSDPAKLAALAAEAAGQREFAVASPTAKQAAPSDAGTAVACIARGAGSGLTGNDRLVRLIEAKFNGAPAYLGVYLESPGAGQPPSKVVIWIVSKADCSVLSLSTKRI